MDPAYILHQLVHSLRTVFCNVGCPASTRSTSYSVMIRVFSDSDKDPWGWKVGMGGISGDLGSGFEHEKF